MSRHTKILLYLIIFLTIACIGAHKKINPELSNFIQLLVQTNEASLAEYSKFSGECGGELELDFMLQECQSRGWDIYSKSCIDYTKRRCLSADQEKSLVLSWLRKKFSTIGKTPKIINISSSTEGFKHDIVEIIIGQNTFLLFHNTDANKPTALIVGVYKINGKKVTEYLEKQ